MQQPTRTTSPENADQQDMVTRTPGQPPLPVPSHRNTLQGPSARVALVPLLITAIVSLAGGGLAGAILNARETSQRTEEINRRVIATVRVDLDRLDEILAHNVRTVVVDEERARAFVRFPTQTYEILLFGGQFELLSNGRLIEALVAYLNQAYHANAMIGLFEQLEVQAPEPGSARWQKRREYLLSINQISKNDMPQVLTDLRSALPQT